MAEKSDKRVGENSRQSGSRVDDIPVDSVADQSQASRLYWQAQDGALTKARAGNRGWSAKRRAGEKHSGNEIWKRVTYSLPRKEAQAKAREFLKKYPKAAYWSEVESWRELPDDVIEFTMRRLPTAD